MMISNRAVKTMSLDLLPKLNSLLQAGPGKRPSREIMLFIGKPKGRSMMISKGRARGPLSW